MTRQDIQKWRNFLDAAIAPLAKSGAVHLLCNDPDLFVFKTIADALLAREQCESAVEYFIAHRAWPALDAEQTIYLTHRVVAAQLALNVCLRQESAWAQIRPTPPTDTSDEAAMIRWLLIELWDQGGANYLKAWAEGYLAKNPPPPGYRV